MKNSKRSTILVLILTVALTAPGAAQENLVDHPDLVECYSWTDGCTPTASAMVLSYYDHYAEGVGKYINWGKLIDHYHVRDGNNVPNLLDELVTELGTDSQGITSMDNISGGLRSTIESRNGYDCWIGTAGGVDDCWNALVSDIDANWTCLYSLFPETGPIGHSTAAWGYRRSLFARYVVLYDTWDWNPVLPYPANYREDWNIRLYYGGSSPVPARDPLLHRIHLSHTDTQDDDVKLDQPYGGEVIPAGRPYTIHWYQWGDRIDNVTLEMSRNDGNSWTQIATNVPSVGQGWHSYVWDVPCIDDADVRVRVRACDRIFLINFLVAGDGSFARCRISRADPTPPPGTYADRTTVAPGETFTLSWGASSNASSYELSENGTWHDVGSARQITKSFPSEGRYAYRVRAVGDCANSAANNQVSVTVQIPLVQPAGFRADPQDPQAGEPVTLSWQPVDGALKYSLSTGGEWRDVGNVTNVVVNHDADGDYEYRVKALGSYAEGPATAPLVVGVRTFCEVWPGDLDDDGVVAADDVMALATCWDRTGGSREANGMEWRGVTTPAWPTIPATYADADGNGRVEMGDFLAVCVNWGRTHDVSGGVGQMAAPEVDHGVLAMLYSHVHDAVAGPQYEIRRFLEDKLGIETPACFAMLGNHPNPFNPSTRIEYEVPVRSRVSMRIFDLSGALVRELVNAEHAPGVHAATWNGDDMQGRPVPAGVYFYRIDAPGFRETRKMILVK